MSNCILSSFKNALHMAIKIDKNVQGLYTITNIDNNVVIEEGITELEIKKFFINKRLWEFISDVIKIDGDFPHGFFINGKMSVGELKGAQYVAYALQQENTEELLLNKFLSIKDNLNLEFDIIGT